MKLTHIIREKIAECRDTHTQQERLLTHLGDDALIVRVNAMLALGTREPQNEALTVGALLRAAMVADSKEPVIGTMTERMLAAYAMNGISSPLSAVATSQIEQSLSPEETKDLHWNIQNNPIAILRESYK